MRPDATAERAGAVVCSIGLLVAALSLVLAAIAGPPYLGLEGINGWMIVFVAALLAALIATAVRARGRGCAGPTPTAMRAGTGRSPSGAGSPSS